MKLSKKQVDELQQIESDRQANQTTLMAALAFSNDTDAKIGKRHRELWAELAEIHGLDLNNKRYIVQTVDGVAQVVEVVEQPPQTIDQAQEQSVQ